MEQISFQGNSIIFLHQDKKKVTKYYNLISRDGVFVEQDRGNHELTMLQKCTDISGIMKALDFTYKKDNKYVKEIVMEYMPNGDLKKYLRNNNVDWQTKLAWIKSIYLSLDKLHGVELCHNDIKASNILLNEKLEAYITDLGSACEMGQIATSGTEGWASPEAFETGCTASTDWHAFGILVKEIAIDCDYDDYEEDVVKTIKQPDQAPQEVLNLIKYCTESKDGHVKLKDMLLSAC